MNKIKSIKFENIKSFGSGNQSFNFKFDNCDANCVNIIVAPNGSGKSSLATALKSISKGRLKLATIDRYNDNCNPSVTINLAGDHEGSYTSDLDNSESSRKMDIFVINNPLNARKINRYFAGNMATSAELSIDGIELYKKIPPKHEMGYKYREECNRYDLKKIYFINLCNLFLDYNFLELLLKYKSDIQKCYTQKRIQKLFIQFIDLIKLGNYLGCDFKETKEKILENGYFNNIKIITTRYFNEADEDKILLNTIVLINFIGRMLEDNQKIVKQSMDYQKYKFYVERINEHLNLFNTTGRELQAKRKNSTLLIDFSNPRVMSNGERDILSFIGNLVKFEINFTKDVGILIIDEVFDYLDGNNLIAVQYYISEFIKRCKNNGKILFPIILTHLDPSIFKTYFLRKQKIHYYAPHVYEINEDDIIRLIKERASLQSGHKRDSIEKFCLHYCDKPINLSEFDIEIENFNTNIDLYCNLFEEVREKYLNNSSLIFNPIKVALALRIKIEKDIFDKLNEDKKIEFIDTHKTINKIEFSEKNSIELSDAYYILRPLYNEVIHLSNDDRLNKNKYISCCLYLSNKVIRNMIEKIFNEH